MRTKKLIALFVITGFSSIAIIDRMQSAEPPTSQSNSNEIINHQNLKQDDNGQA